MVFRLVLLVYVWGKPLGEEKRLLEDHFAFLCLALIVNTIATTKTITKATIIIPRISSAGSGIAESDGTQVAGGDGGSAFISSSLIGGDFFFLIMMTSIAATIITMITTMLP